MLLGRQGDKMALELVGQFIATLFWTFVLAEEPKLQRKLLSESESSYQLYGSAFNVYKSTQETLKDNKSTKVQSDCRKTAKKPPTQKSVV